MTVAERIKNLRQACGFSQQQIANALGIERSTYAYLENGKTHLYFDDAIRIAQIFGVSLDALAGKSDDALF